MSDLLARDAAHLWHPYTQHRVDREPMAVRSGSGAWLELEDGSRVIDGISSWWTSLHGHGHPALIEAMTEQARTLDHVLFAGATHEPAVALTEELLEVAPAGLNRSFFTDNGSTAVEVALKMALLAWHRRGESQRRVFVALEGSYHGDTFGAMSLGDPDPFFEDLGPFLFESRRVPPTEEALARVLEELGDRAAGLIVEPLVQGAAGMRMHGPEFLRSARALCDQHAIPLVADEVMTGFARTGAMFACDVAGIAPDLMCIAKGLTGGVVPLAVTLATEEIFEAFLDEDRTRFLPHGHTWTAHPIGCAVARASLRLTLEENVPARLDAIGKRILAGLAPLGGNPAVHGLRQRGGIVAFDLEPSAGEGQGYHSDFAPRLRRAALERGVLLRPLGNVLYALPPACLTDEEADKIAEVMVQLAEG